MKKYYHHVVHATLLRRNQRKKMQSIFLFLPPNARKSNFLFRVSLKSFFYFSLHSFPHFVQLKSFQPSCNYDFFKSSMEIIFPFSFFKFHTLTKKHFYPLNTSLKLCVCVCQKTFQKAVYKMKKTTSKECHRH